MMHDDDVFKKVALTLCMLRPNKKIPMFRVPDPT